MSRYLRIAAAVALGLLALAFLGLWVRSYWRLQIIETRGRDYAAQVSSVNGHFAIARLAPHTTIGQSYLRVVAGDAADWRKKGLLGFGFHDGGSITALIVPHWFLAFSLFALAAIFAAKRNLRFTVRGLLITTTAIAAMLGLVVYAV